MFIISVLPEIHSVGPKRCIEEKPSVIELVQYCPALTLLFSTQQRQKQLNTAGALTIIQTAQMRVVRGTGRTIMWYGKFGMSWIPTLAPPTITMTTTGTAIRVAMVGTTMINSWMGHKGHGT